MKQIKLKNNLKSGLKNNKKKWRVVGLLTLILIIIIAGALFHISNSGKLLSKIVSLEDFEEFGTAGGITELEIIQVSAYPEKVKRGEVLLIRVEIKDKYGISSVTAEMPYEGGNDTINLNLISGDSKSGVFEGSWRVHDTVQKCYTTVVEVTNRNNEKVFASVQWEDPTVYHSAEQITKGSFSEGNFVFPNNVSVLGAFEHGCPNTSTNQMVKVGDFCIDKYEAYLVSGSKGNSNGNDTTAVAGSKSGENPLTSITWFQAAQACANAGKRLCTNAEWQIAVSGTPDPVSSAPTEGTESCHIWNTGGWPDYSSRKPDGSTWSDSPSGNNSIKTGTASKCKSRWDVYDMVGNVWEWTADWALHPGWNGDLSSMTAEYGSDGYWHGGPNDASNPTRGADGSWRPYAPAMTGNGDTAGEETSFAAAIRGGDWYCGAYAGSFALALANAPSHSYASFGFRCCS